MENYLIAFGLTAVAGLSTVIGCFISFAANKDNKKFLSASLGFSAGVMIYVSFVEIFVKARDSLALELGFKEGTIVTVAGFFGGMILIAIIDKLIPEKVNPHEICNAETDGECDNEKNKEANLKRMGVFTALAIGIHNFPEGLATFVAALDDLYLAIPIVVAIAIHNIPEGVAVAVPIYQATGSKAKAFKYTLLSGLSEPVGALVGMLILIPIMSDMVYGIIFAAVAGIMVFISIDELLPAAREYGHHHLSIYGMIGGMMVMAASLILFI